jgi:2-oxoglutarate/2-oxoacid ferredoxin oxidoreductase subunit alpha
MTKHVRKTTTIRLAGESGEGVVSSGQILTDTLVEQGFAILTYQTYPAEIKGGHCWYQVRASAHALDTPGDRVDILVAFNQEGYDTHTDDLRSGSLILYDAESVTPTEIAGVHLFPVALSKIATEDVGSPRSKNVLAAAILARLVGLPKDDVKDSVGAKFRYKGEKIVEVNRLAVEVAYNLVLPEVEMDFALTRMEATGEIKGQVALTGSDAMVLGALTGGCRFFAGYPITPASSILEALTRELPAWGGAAIQTEDEMSALAHCVGASFAGKKVMTATSGPGFSLMMELMCLASSVELPLVIADLQRGGPSTGLPTKYEQSDLFTAAFGGHGDSPRIVIAPSNVRECFDLTVKAFNLAERYQMPVVLLADNALSTRLDRVALPDLNTVPVEDRILASPDPTQPERFKRYLFTESGISPFPVPGMPGGQYIAEGLEHDETGKPNYDGANHEAMNRKRFAKLIDCQEREAGHTAIGADDPDLLIIGWGAIAGSVREAVDRLTAEDLNVGGMVVTMPWPFPTQAHARIRKAKAVLVAEGNYQGQLAHIITAETGVTVHKVTFARGNLLPVERVIERAKELLPVKEVHA